MDWTNLLNDIIYALIVVILPIITKYAVDALKAFADNQSSGVNDVTSSMIYKAEDIVSNIVVALNQTVVESAKRAGKWNKETAEAVKKEATDKAYELISDTTKQLIHETYNSFSGWLDVQIEKNVNENK